MTTIQLQTVELKNLRVTPFFEDATSTLSYIVFDQASLDAVVIDPVLDFDPASGKTNTTSIQALAQFVHNHSLRVRLILETHAHADHLSGSQALKRRYDAPIAIGERIPEVQATFAPLFGLPPTFRQDGSQFDRLLHDGEMIQAGTVTISVLGTPGHTPACSSYRIENSVFTGDALFMDDSGTGRCDFPRGSADDLYDSIHEKLYRLPDETLAFVGHDYQPGGRGVACQTTIGSAKRNNIQLKQETSRPDFVHFRSERDKTLAAPRLLLPSIQINIDAGRMPPADAAGKRSLRLPLNLGRATRDDGNPE